MNVLPSAAPAYVELHAHSAFTFLDGVDTPAAMVEEAARLGLEGLAILDCDGMYSAVQTQTRARECGLAVVHGAELTLDRAALASAALGAASLGWGLPGGAHDPGIRLPVLSTSPQGRRHLCRAMSDHILSHLGRREASHVLEDLATYAHDWLILTGGVRGPLRRALYEGGASAAGRLLDHLIHLFGTEAIAVESALTPTDPPALANALADLATRKKLPLVATTAARMATPASHRLGDVLAATRLGMSMESAQPHLPGLRSFLRSGEEMLRIHHLHPHAVATAAALGQSAAFDLRLSAPHLPKTQVPAGHTPASWLRHLTEKGAHQRYGSRKDAPCAWATIDHELDVITSLDFPGYFLIVKDIVDFCASRNILCQGRGSAANSAVCFCLGITAVDAIRHRLLFERFLSPGRSGPPDIDIDIEAGRREEVIQYVYSRYGRHRAALVANVISYRPRSAIRDAAKALGYGADTATQWSTSTHRSGSDSPAPAPVLTVANALLRLPRHMGIHPGGMVLTDTPVAEVCPLNWGAMKDRSVLQWDKDDCADAGLVKFDLLGLGMLTALRTAFNALEQVGVRGRDSRPLTLHNLPEEDPRVYDLLCAADTIGVFQVESRAQMNTLPRLAPRCFYDIVIEVALIRPGPIQGRAINPYLRRRRGREDVTYPHPLLRPALEKTLGVPLFQEQLMQIAVDAAGFTPAMADQLRRAMGSKRSPERMEALRQPLLDGMAQRGIPENVATTIYDQLRGFADFGFPESHAFSFAHIVYASAWLKVHHPEYFYAALLASQPMGFYSPSSLIHDARRHGVKIGPICVQHSVLEARVAPATPDLDTPDIRAPTPVDTEESQCVRLGLSSIKGLGGAAQRIIDAREKGGPFASLADLASRAHLRQRELDVLAQAGACDALGDTRRQALWSAAAVAQEHWHQPFLPGTEIGATAPALPAMTAEETLLADHESTGFTPGEHPMALVRKGSHRQSSADKQTYGHESRGEGSKKVSHPSHAPHAARGQEWEDVLTCADLDTTQPGDVVTVAGLVTHRQRPHTGAGITFLSLEDDYGLINITCTADVWNAHRRVAASARALRIRGRVEKSDGATSIRAHRIWDIPTPLPVRSRDFR
ncbi:MAG: error-prone DNA polymerase [Actinomycetaceae bacterium]|nr:error-prone DNA polymerase [Actinomycetaceae bacterium]